jgi:hypothetical protein
MLSPVAAAVPYQHPRLLFSNDDLPGLRAKVHDGGVDDAFYAYIHDRIHTYYLVQPYDSLLRNDFALEAMMNIGLVTQLEEPVDPSQQPGGLVGTPSSSIAGHVVGSAAMPSCARKMHHDDGGGSVFTHVSCWTVPGVHSAGPVTSS